MAGRPKKVSKFTGRRNLTRAGGASSKSLKNKNKIASNVNETNYHPDSIKYMKEKLGRTPSQQEAVELDREWAANKTAQGMSTELLMGAKQLNDRVINKRDLVSRQFKDVVDTGKADATVVDVQGSAISALDDEQLDRKVG